MNTPSDAQLVAFVRAGEMSAYDELHQRHLAVARRTARVVADTDDEADAIVTDAFERVRVHITDGPTPALPFAIHVRTVVRRIALDRYRSGGRPAASTAGDPAGVLTDTGTDRGADDDVDDTPAHEDVAGVEPPVGPRLDAAPSDDEAARMSERQLVRAGYEALPERWQRVLWRTEVEEQTPAALAPELGSSPNSVAALAFRAREGLRQAYLAVNHAAAADDQCRPTITRLAGYVRQTLPEAEDVAVAIHLDTCAECRARREELLLLVSDLRTLLVAALVGTVPPSRPAAVAPAGAVASMATGAPAVIAAAHRPRVRSRRAIQVAATTLVSAAAAVGVAFAVVTSMSPGRPPEDALVAPPPSAPAYEPATSSMTNPSARAEQPPATTVEEDDEHDDEDAGVDDETGTGAGGDERATVSPPTAVRPATQSANETPAGGSHADAPESDTTATTQPSGPPTSTPAGTPTRRSSQPAPSDPPSSPPPAPPANEPPDDDGDIPDSGPSPTPGDPQGQEQSGLCVVLPIPLLCP